MKINNLTLRFWIIFYTLLPYSALAQEIDDSQDKPVAKLVEEIKCKNNKKIQINNYVYKNEAKNKTSIKLGEFFNAWVAYREAYYYGEANNYLLINKMTCVKYPIDGENLDFLDDNTFLTWSWDFEGGYSTNQISIFIIKNDKVEKVNEFEPDEGGPSDAKWIDRNTIKFKLVQFNHDQKSEVVYIYKDKIIVKRGNEWVYKN